MDANFWNSGRPGRYVMGHGDEHLHHGVHYRDPIPLIQPSSGYYHKTKIHIR
jgi:hypothetical protein